MILVLRCDSIATGGSIPKNWACIFLNGVIVNITSDGVTASRIELEQASRQVRKPSINNLDGWHPRETNVAITLASLENRKILCILTAFYVVYSFILMAKVAAHSSSGGGVPLSSGPGIGRCE